MPDQRPVLNRETLVPIGLAVFVVSLVAGGAWWMSAVYGELRQLRVETTRLADRVDSNAEKVWERLHDHEARLIRMEAAP